MQSTASETTSLPVPELLPVLLPRRIHQADQHRVLLPALSNSLHRLRDSNTIQQTVNLQAVKLVPQHLSELEQTTQPSQVFNTASPVSNLRASPRQSELERKEAASPAKDSLQVDSPQDWHLSTHLTSDLATVTRALQAHPKDLLQLNHHQLF